MAMRRKKGRPKLPNDSVRRFSIHVLVNAEERRIVKKAAAAADMTMSAWAREKILAGLPKSR